MCTYIQHSTAHLCSMYLIKPSQISTCCILLSLPSFTDRVVHHDNHHHHIIPTLHTTSFMYASQSNRGAAEQGRKKKGDGRPWMVILKGSRARQGRAGWSREQLVLQLGDRTAVQSSSRSGSRSWMMTQGMQTCLAQGAARDDRSWSCSRPGRGKKSLAGRNARRGY